jgi:hypothetical protein
MAIVDETGSSDCVESTSKIGKWPLFAYWNPAVLLFQSPQYSRLTLLANKMHEPQCREKSYEQAALR